MSRSYKEDYLHTMNRIARLEKKKSEIDEKKKSCNDRVKRLIVSWIKKNHKEWLEKAGKDDMFINVIPNPENKHGEMLVRIYEFTPDPELDGVESGQWVNHSIKINEL